MQRRTLTSPGVIGVLLVLQLVPLVLFPPALFTITAQDWWLPVLLAILVLIGDFQIIVRRTVELGPWYLFGFAQGFNLISRIMMIWAHATTTLDSGAVLPDWTYVVLTLISMAMSGFMLWYTEKPEVRMGFLPKG